MVLCDMVLQRFCMRKHLLLITEAARPLGWEMTNRCDMLFPCFEVIEEAVVLWAVSQVTCVRFQIS
jgi:hypothetical protein